MGASVKQGDDVVLYLDERRQYLVRAEKDKKLHTHRGIIDFNEILGKPFGGAAQSSMGRRFYVLQPLLSDYVSKTARKTQILYPKDISLLVMFTGIGPGSRVVEGGTGSGALTAALAHYVRPMGRVYSYEVREEFLDNARKNLDRVNLLQFVDLKLHDMTMGVEEKDVDVVVLDLGAPWEVVPRACDALKGGGVLASFSPTVNQVEKTVAALRQLGFANIRVFESLLRRYQAEEGMMRPETLMIGHTGFLTLARKVLGCPCYDRE